MSFGHRLLDFNDRTGVSDRMAVWLVALAGEPGQGPQAPMTTPAGLVKKGKSGPDPERLGLAPSNRFCTILPLMGGNHDQRKTVRNGSFGMQFGTGRTLLPDAHRGGADDERLCFFVELQIESLTERGKWKATAEDIRLWVGGNGSRLFRMLDADGRFKILSAPLKRQFSDDQKHEVTRGMLSRAGGTEAKSQKGPHDCVLGTGAQAGRQYGGGHRGLEPDGV